MFRPARAFIVVTALAGLTSCLGLPSPFFSFYLLNANLEGSVTCPKVRFRAEFAGEVVRNSSPTEPDLDGTWVADVSGPDRANIIGHVGATNGWPRWGETFDLRVDCLNELEEVIGVSRFQGQLMTPGRPSSVRVLNYAPPPGGRHCYPPTLGSGVTLCAELEGFALD